MAVILWKLSQPSTGLLREAQVFQIGFKSWSLWWIAEKNEGGGRNEALVFSGVEAVKQTQFLAYAPDLIDKTYDTLIDAGKTSFLSDICTNLEMRSSPTSDLRHLAISFDTSPLFEFIARGFEFQSSFDVSAIESSVRDRIASCVHPLTTEKEA